MYTGMYDVTRGHVMMIHVYRKILKIYMYNVNHLTVFWRFGSVVVITFALRAKGPGFEPQSNQFVFFLFFKKHREKIQSKFSLAASETEKKLK